MPFLFTSTVIEYIKTQIISHNVLAFVEIVYNNTYEKGHYKIHTIALNVIEARAN